MIVSLRAVRAEDLELISGGESTGTGTPFDDWGYRGAGALRRQFEADGFLPEGWERGRLAILGDGILAGTASWYPVQHGPNVGSRAFNLGIVLLPDRRAKGIGPHALRALARYLFDHTLVMRLEGSTDVENVAMQKAAERAGFTKEGVLRRAQFRLGAHHDLILYSLLRGELSAESS